MKKAEENVRNPFKGGFPMFSMDFASKGLSWAGNVCQKWENICLDNIIGQDPSRYVDAFGEHFRKICEEVAEDWRNPFLDSCVKGPVSDLSIEHDVIAEVCKRCKTRPDEHLVNDVSSLPVESEPVVSSKKYLSHASIRDASEDATPEEACNVFNKNTGPTLVEVFGYNFPYETSGNIKEVADPVASAANTSVSLATASADADLPSNVPEDELMKSGQMLSSRTLSTEVNGCFTSQEGISLVGSFEDVGQQSNPTDLDASLSIMDITVAECSGGFDREKETEGSNSDDANRELVDEFEDVRLDDFRDAEKYETALISYRTRKNMSYKKKLRNAIASKVCPSRNKYKQATNWYNSIGVDEAKREETTSSREVSTQDPLEPDWELV